MDRAIEPSYEQDPFDASLDAPDGAEALQIPTRREALAWLYVECESRPQAWVAAQLRMNQGSVSRTLARACAKVAALIDSGFFEREKLEQLLRKHVGAAFTPRRA
jgi:hypothetical protein